MPLSSILRDSLSLPLSMNSVWPSCAVKPENDGQVIAGADLIARQFPDHRLIRQTVVVSGEPDPALRWVCEKQGIRVAAVPAPW